MIKRVRELSHRHKINTACFFQKKLFHYKYQKIEGPSLSSLNKVVTKHTRYNHSVVSFDEQVVATQKSDEFTVVLKLFGAFTSVLNRNYFHSKNSII